MFLFGFVVFFPAWRSSLTAARARFHCARFDSLHCGPARFFPLLGGAVSSSCPLMGFGCFRSLTVFHVYFFTPPDPLLPSLFPRLVCVPCSLSRAFPRAGTSLSDSLYRSFPPPSFSVPSPWVSCPPTLYPPLAVRFPLLFLSPGPTSPPLVPGRPFCRIWLFPPTAPNISVSVVKPLSWCYSPPVAPYSCLPGGIRVRDGWFFRLLSSSAVGSPSGAAVALRAHTRHVRSPARGAALLCVTSDFCPTFPVSCFLPCAHLRHACL